MRPKHRPLSGRAPPEGGSYTISQRLTRPAHKVAPNCRPMNQTEGPARQRTPPLTAHGRRPAIAAGAFSAPRRDDDAGYVKVGSPSAFGSIRIWVNPHLAIRMSASLIAGCSPAERAMRRPEFAVRGI